MVQPASKRLLTEAVGNATYERRTADLHADFTSSVGRPAVADSGQTFGWGYTGADHIVITDGLLLNDGTAGQYYLDASLSGPVTTVGAEVVFFTGTASGLVLGSFTAPGITFTDGWSGQRSRCHVILYTDRVEFYANGTGIAPSVTLIKTQTLPTALTTHASSAAWIAAGRPTNVVEAIIRDSTAVVIVNGVALPPITHAAINGTDTYPFWEAYTPVVGLKSIWASTTPERATITPTGGLAQAAANAQKRADDAYNAAPTLVVRIPPQLFTVRGGTPVITHGAIDMPHWAFDAAATESVRAYATVPLGWTTFDVVVVCVNPTAATGDVRLLLQVQILGINGAALLGATQASPGAAHTAGALGVRQDIVMGVDLGRSAPASGHIIVSVHRQGADGTDTLAADYGVAFVELRKKT